MAALEIDITAAIKARVDAGGLVWPIAWQNVDHEGMSKPYIVVSVVKINRRDDTLNGENTISLGRVVATTVTATGIGSRTGELKAQQFADLFPMGLIIPVTNGQIVFTKPADIQEGFPQGADWRTPVIAQYEAS
jgi:hypothetical protein